MNIRISHQIKGVAEPILPYIYENKYIKNILIISPPGCGKTTLLRDMIRLVSDGNQYGRGVTVGVVDERSEIAGCYLGKPQNDVGFRTDVLDACPKAIGMMMLLRSMSPKVIAIDELGSEEEMKAVHVAASCGTKVLATIHGDDLEDIRTKEGMGKVFSEHIFDTFLLLKKENGKCFIHSIYEYSRQEGYQCRK